MRARPSTAAVLAAYQVLRPGDLVPPLQISDPLFEQLRTALAAAYRIDYQTIDQVRLLRAVYIYRGAINLMGSPRNAGELGRPVMLSPVEAVLQAAAVLAEAERFTRLDPSLEEPADADSQLSLG